MLEITPDMRKALERSMNAAIRQYAEELGRGGPSLTEQRDAAVAEAAMLARQLQSIADLCGRSRLGWVRVSAIHQLIITDPADEETP